jgi:DNA-binding transcriptional LysR family regulator
MDIRGLEVFLSVAKHLNYTRAGEEVNLSQPSVSVRIRQLESDLGVKLFEQLGKKVAMTEAGALLVPYASRVIAAVKDARGAIEEIQGLERGSLSLGASTTPGMYLMPKIIARFKQKHPKIEIHLGIRDTRQVEEGVIRNEFDFGFVGGHLAGGQVDVLPWRKDELVLIVPPGHRFLGKKLIRPDALSHEKFIFREQGSATQAAVIGHLQKWDLQAEAIIEMENPESVKRGVQHGLGIAFISKFAVETELEAGILGQVKIKGLDIFRELKIVYRKDKHLSYAARTFIEMSREARHLTYCLAEERTEPR